MQKNQFVLLVALSIGFVTNSIAQHNRYTIKNGIGFIGGVTQYNINSDNFASTSGNGYMFGMIATVDIPPKWFTVSGGLQFSKNSFEMLLPFYTDRMAEFELKLVQATFLLHVKLLKDNVTLDLGPQLQYNSELELKSLTNISPFETDYPYTLLQYELYNEISPFNVNGVVGASVGFGNFRLRVAYSHGLTNILNNLNDPMFTLRTERKGRQSMLTFALMITL